MRNSASILAIALLALIAAPASATDREMFPPAVISAGGGASFPAKLGEPPLWKSGLSAKYQQRIRLFIGGHTISSWSIRVDVRRDGRARLFFPQHDGKEIVEQHSLQVKNGDLADLEKRISNANLWRMFPQFFVADLHDNEICIDGMTVIFERSDSNGYRYAEGNAQCTMEPAQKAVAEKLMQMARQPDLISLLH